MDPFLSQGFMDSTESNHCNATDKPNEPAGLREAYPAGKHPELVCIGIGGVGVRFQTS